MPILKTYPSRFRAAACAAVFAFCVLPFVSAEGDQDSLRQEIEAERQSLSELMRRLESEMATAREQAKRLDALEERLMAGSGGTVTAATTVKSVSPAVTEATPSGSLASFEEVGASETEVVTLDRVEVGPNQSMDSHTVMTAGDLVSDDFVGSWPMFGTNYRMRFGGYFKFDALYDLDGTTDRYQFLISQIPVEGSPADDFSGYFNMFVRETRFNFDVRNTGMDGPAQQFFLEMDFFDLGSTSPRLRHAYVVYGNLLVGQTWSTVVDLTSIPFTLDFAAGDALYGTRTPQVRWQQDIDENWSWAVALEQLQTSGIYNPLNLPGVANPQLPVLAARVTHQRSRGSRSLAAQVQQLRWDGGGLVPDSTAAGWALMFSGRENLTDNDFLTWNLAYGDGTADEIMALTGSEANAVLSLSEGVVPRQGYSIALGFGHKWSESLSSNLTYAFTDLEDLGDGQRVPDAIQSGGVGHLNLIWTPAEKFTTGVEFMWGRREHADGAEGTATRVQSMFKFEF